MSNIRKAVMATAIIVPLTGFTLAFTEPQPLRTLNEGITTNEESTQPEETHSTATPTTETTTTTTTDTNGDGDVRGTNSQTQPTQTTTVTPPAPAPQPAPSPKAQPAPYNPQVEPQPCDANCVSPGVGVRP